MFLNGVEEKILKVLQQTDSPASARVMLSVLILHRAQHGPKSCASKFSRPLANDFQPEIEELSLFNHYGLRKVPLRAQRALVMWHLDVYPIQLLHYTPSPWQILEMQAQGKRCVSMDNTPGCLSRTYEGKNYFEFILHDLIHADHFFHLPENKLGQMGFARFMLQLKENSRLGFLEDADFQNQFQSEFDYLISDMNTHPLHLVLTLKSLLDRYFRDSRISDEWLKQAFQEVPGLAETLIAKDRAQSVNSIERLFTHKATEQFRLYL